MSTPLRMALSRLVGWAADRRIPGPLRAPVYRGYARLTGADLDEARGPLEVYPSLSAFFVRRLVDGARPLCDERLLASPVDGRVQSAEPIAGEEVLQAKGRAYRLRELLGGVGAELELDGGFTWTLYLSPRDYHRIHAPVAGQLVEARWMPGARHSVAPKVLARRMVLPINERVALRLETGCGPLLLVLVGALNVGRIRVLGVEPGHAGPLERPLALERGAELARFEMGSTVVVVAPRGSWRGDEALTPGAPVRQGAAIGRRGPA